MTRKSKRILSRILAVVLAVTLVPSNMWGTANVVRAEETTEVFTEEDADVSTDDVQEPQEEAGEKETSEPSVVADKGEDSAPVDAEEIVEDDKKSEVKPEKKETEKVSAETDNKGTVAYVHNFTTDNNLTDSFFEIDGNLQTGKSEVKYTDHTGTELSLTGIMKFESKKGTISFTAQSAGTLILITDANAKTRVDSTDQQSDANGVNRIQLAAGAHNVARSSTDTKAAMLYYIAFITEVGDPAAKPTADPASGSTVKVGETIDLSSTTTDATIYYTTDGSDPKTSSAKVEYETPIKITRAMIGSLTIKAYAGGGEYSASDVATFTYTVAKSDTQLDPPTATPGDPENVTEVERGTLVTLTGGTSIRYTFDKDEELTETSGTEYTDPIPIEKDNTIIKAIAVADNPDDNSAEAIYKYTLKKSTITVADDSKNIISSVGKDDDVFFEDTDGKGVYTVQLSAKKTTSVSADITQKVEDLKDADGEVLHFDLFLSKEGNDSDKVLISEDSTGKIKITMPYSISEKADRNSKITVLSGTDRISGVNTTVQGIVYSINNVSAPLTIIVNPASDDDTAPKTYVLDAEELEKTSSDLETDTKYGTDNYFTVVCTSEKKAAIVDISSVTTKETVNNVETQVPCYTNLTWPDEVLEAIGGGRTRCLRITGGALSTTADAAPLNCVKITTKYPNAKVIVYYSPKDMTARKLRVVKDNAGKVGSLVGTYPSSGVTREKVGVAEFTLADAGTYYIGFDGAGGIIPYMEVTETPVLPQIKAPTAEPDTSTKLNRKSEITLKATDTEFDSEVYYTINGDNPEGAESATEKKYTESIKVADLLANNIIGDDNKQITIKAIAAPKTGVKAKSSNVVTFTYTYDPTAVALAIAEDSKDIIKSVEAVGDLSKVTRSSGKLEVTDITVKAEVVDVENVDPDIKTAAEELVTDAEKSNIQYYNISLILDEDTDVSENVTFDNAGAAIKIKMLYSLFKTDALGDVTNKNEIFVLHKTDTISDIFKERVNAEEAGFTFEANSFSPYTVVVNPAKTNDGPIKITDSDTYEEGIYAEWEAVDGADGYKVYVSPTENGDYTRIDNELIREYEDYWRADVVGLAKGNYYLKIEAVQLETEGDDENVDVLAEIVDGPLKVTENYDRSGFAFSSTSAKVDGESSFGTGSGAYNDDGTLKEGAQVIYVTKDTAKSCKAMIHTGGANKPAVEVTGLQSILDAKQKKGTEKDIIDIRIIGRVAKDDLDHISSKAEGLQVKGAAKYNEMNITIEGIGEDAVVHGFGFLIRNCCNVEFRNFAIMAFMDDGVSLDTANKNIWIHDLDIFYGSTGGDSDQAKGDGSVDVKGKSTFITISYNHFWDSGKCSLCGMSDSAEFAVTYHHNWFDHSDSRHPRIRVGSIHVYNNYFDGNSKYGVGVTKGSSAFVEANYFRNCNYPMMSSKQGTDAMGDGTFSGENGGIIKAYNNKIEGATKLVYANSGDGTMAANAASFDAYLASARNEKVPNTYKTVAGGTTYNNFDTNYDLGVEESAIHSADKVKDVVTEKAGRLNGGDFERKPSYSISNNDQSYAVDTVLKADVVGYQSSIKFIGGIKGVSGGGGTLPPGSGGEVLGGELYAHNFTTDGFTSDDFFTITGSEQSSPTTVNYVDPNGEALTLTKALKMESSTNISFSADVSGTLYIVTSGKIKVDNEEQEPTDDAIEMYFDTAGSHSITMGDEAAIYYIAYLEDTYDADDVLAPTFGVPSGKVPIGTQITLSCKTAGAEIHYTTDGTPPSASSPKYTAPFAISGAEGDQVTVKAIAIKGDAESAVVSCTYTLMDPDKYVAEPVASQGSGTIAKGTAITLSSLTEDAKIYYTYKMDGTQPADPDEENGTLYTGAIVITRSTTIKAIAIKGNIKSAISTFTYTVSSGGSGSENTGAKTFEFNPQWQELAVDTLPAADTKYGTDDYFTIKGIKDSSGTLKTKIASISGNGTAAPTGSKSGSGIENYTSRFQFGGKVAGAANDGAIRFTTYGSAQVTVCAYLTGKKSGTDEYESRSLYLDEDTNAWLPAGGTPTEHTFTVAKGDHGIYAKDGDFAILYVIVEDTDVPGAGDSSGGDDEVTVSEPVATPPSGSYAVGTKISLGAELGAKIYYTTDSSDPSTKSTLYTKEIVLEKDMTIKAIAELEGTVSEPAIFEYTVKADGEENPPTGEGLRVVLKNKNEVYTYTGSAIKPDIEVWNNSDKLVEGDDYTVAYKNNINASQEGTKENKKPQITVTGKGNLTGKATTTFEIKQRSLSEVVVAGVQDAENGTDKELLVVENTKPAPVLYYGGAQLTKKDYTVSITDKCVEGDTGKEITITGQGNFTDPISGPLTFKLKVIKKDQLKKFKVTFTDPVYTYNGTSQTLLDEAVVVTDSSEKDTNGNPITLTKNIDYTIVYQKDTTNAGKVKFTVAGLGLYTGSVTKTYTIKPLVAEESAFAFTGVPTSRPYIDTGVTIPTAGITYTDADNVPHKLVQGKDYKLAYGNNKKVGTAKITATFMGNYKGNKISPKEFDITKATLTNDTEGLQIVIPDAVYNNKPGVYKSVPYVSVNDVEVKSSEYIVKYYTSGTKAANGTITINPDTDTEMGSKNKIDLDNPEAKQSAEVFVEITGKGKNYDAETTKLTASYYVRRMPQSANEGTNALDLSKAKLTVYKDWNVDASAVADKANKGAKMEYTGVAVKPGVMIEFKDAAKTKLSPKEVDTLIEQGKLTVQYVNNVNKGKATIVINGDGVNYVGGKTVTFSITTKNLKNEANLLANLFGDISRIIQGGQ